MNDSKDREDGQREKNKIESSTLYVVATPIGNLADISERALKVLSGVDFVAAEDTRNSGLMLSRFGIRKPLVSYHKHNSAMRGEEICSRLEKGESCALVTDAGTPAISDPGEDIVSLCIGRGIKVTSVPGCCAAVNALVLSGLPTGRFVFEGFLSASKTERRKRLAELVSERRTVVFYEAPHKLLQTLTDMLDVFGNRRISLCREMTKLNEEVIRTDLENAVAVFTGGREPKGEFVLVVSGYDGDDGSDAFWSDMSIEEHVGYYISGGMSKNDAVKAAAKDRGVRKNEIYNYLVKSENS